jgi:hypothetical protein
VASGLNPFGFRESAIKRNEVIIIIIFQGINLIDNNDRFVIEARNKGGNRILPA